MYQRPRRNRKSAAIRGMVEETNLSVSHLIYPLFVAENPNEKSEIISMPGIFRWGTEKVLAEIEECIELGIQNFVLFPVVPEKYKTKRGEYSADENNFYLKVATEIKKRFPEIALMSDVALDPYSTDGHDGIVENGIILNDETLPVLANMSLAQAQAGFDIIGPSDMMDGRIRAIREILDDNSYDQTSIMAYSAKYASAFYGPFRDALDSTPKSGDKKSYQMNPANKKEAILEAILDVEEGADFLMVKPALSYLDVIHVLSENFVLPITAYNVSGEYAMVKAASEKGWLNYDATMQETLLSMRRAGANAILTYHAKDFAQLHKK
ncbi:porphobilinogen synthase [Brumimicrobium glaciale]|jgi:porphobilinogen synthase|uniref:Delta-aminolevulinic acid dehydratase n=1 Tax=Brumimicrobium glaciale TaxID=200475 RepID=A0A4Q4KNN5_9FLAO|nr:porphobilinogen synthase [Brumimicrobium glaciale]RYM34630.1 porphobilinogen synthase [Brumimicrobium glaciale]